MNVRPSFLAKRRKPLFKLPPSATDAHCHVFGPGDKFPYAPKRRYTPDDAPKEMLAALHAHLGIGRAVIVQASCHGTDNRAMLDCVASNPKRDRGVAIVDDSFSDADFDKLDAGVEQPPLRALIELAALENCWIKVCGAERISMPPYAAAVPIARALVEAAPTRVRSGTDFPHPNATHEADEANLVDLVPQFAATPLAQRRLLVDNPAQLYGFSA